MQKNQVTKQEVRIELCKRQIKWFAKDIYPTNVLEPFHDTYYKILDMFSNEQIKNLIITMPPQHGKSEGSTRLLPSHILGNYPDKQIAIGSYSTTFARKFNRSVQRIIDSVEYQSIFDNTKLQGIEGAKDIRANYLRNADEFEIVGNKGSLKAVGRGGALTGNPVDVMIMDDLYKDAAEGNSPVIRDSVIEWYSSVVEKRLHNNSQQLIVFTRWHEEDLIGYLEKYSEVIEVESFYQINEILKKDKDIWIKVNFEAIKESEQSELDKRKNGTALWESRHSLKKLTNERVKKPFMFDCMNQGRPSSLEGLLYGDFKTYETLPNIKKLSNYTDTADLGKDYLCSICYGVGNDNRIYLIDVVYSQKKMEDTEQMVSKMINDNGTRECDVESNNGGRSFAREIDKRTGSFTRVRWFHQSQNKESRILTNSPQVNQILMPNDWSIRFPVFYDHVRRYKKDFKANKYDDAPDTLTGVIEKSSMVSTTKTTISSYNKKRR